MEDTLFYSPYFWSPILMGVIYFLVGYFMIKYPPKYRDGLYGYRTPRARKTEAHWVFAQKFSAIMFKKFGLLCLPLCTIGVLAEGRTNNALTIIVVLIALFPAIMTILLTEKYLKEL